MEITIDNILDDDQRRKIAAVIADGTIKDIMVIYRQDKHLIWGTTMTMAHTLGVLTVALDRVREMTQKGWE